jgi:hypothetical protein
LSGGVIAINGHRAAMAILGSSPSPADPLEHDVAEAVRRGV